MLALKPFAFPFDFKHKLIVLSIVLNGKKALRVVLDSGMPGDGLLLFRTPCVEEFISASVSNPADESDFFKNTPFRMMHDIVFDLPGLRMHEQQALLVDCNPFPPSSRIDGVIGYSLLNRFAIELNFEKCLLRCTEPGTYFDEDAYLQIPVTLREDYPFVPCSIEFESGKQLAVDAYLDLGLTSSLILNSESHNEFATVVSAPEAAVNSPLGGTIRGQVIGVDTLTLGDYSLHGIAAVSCLDEMIRITGKEDVHEASIGLDVLRRFKFIIDYTNRCLLIAPGAGFKESARTELSGHLLSV